MKFIKVINTGKGQNSFNQALYMIQIQNECV